MSLTIERPPAAAGGPAQRRNRLWNRRLEHYPETRARLGYLGIVVAVTVLLYWQLYVDGGAATRILRDLHMSFLYFTGLTAVGAAIGAFASLAAGLADRWGRANLVAYGRRVDGADHARRLSAVRHQVRVRGLLRRAEPRRRRRARRTAALVRDFSPQVGRGSAMGFWTLGPVLGSLVVTVVASQTLDRYDSWQSQFVICGIAGAVIAVVAIFFLRELSPNLRDQLMVDLGDRELVEARAHSGEGIQHARRAARVRRGGQGARARPGAGRLARADPLLHARRVRGGAAGDHVRLLREPRQRARQLVLGHLRGLPRPRRAAVDRLRVRKPFLLAGGLGFAALTIVFIGKLADPTTSYGTLRALLIGMAAFQSVLYVPWMAAFTETVEDIHPSLVATGLAVWGWIVRIVICATFLALPHIVSGVSTLVEAPTPAVLQAQGAKLKAEQAQLGEKAGRRTKLRAAAGRRRTGARPRPSSSAAWAKLRARRSQQQGASLKARGAAFQAKVADLKATATAVPKGWQTWLWLCVAGQLLFIPLALLLRGRWSPAAAAADLSRHDVEIDRALARITAEH